MIQNQSLSNSQALNQTEQAIAVSSATSDPPTVGGIRDILTQGGTTAAVILAMAVFLLAIAYFQKIQFKAVTKLIETAKKKGD